MCFGKRSTAWLGGSGWVLLLVFSGILSWGESSNNDPVRLQVSLEDGSRLVGTTRLVSLPLQSEAAGSFSIPLDRIATIQFITNRPSARVILRNRDHVKGVVGLSDLDLETLFGRVSVPLKLATRIVIFPQNNGNLPDGLVLWYSFDADTEDQVTDQSGHEHHGRMEKATRVAEGKVGSAIRFGAYGAAIRVGNPPGLRLQDFTIAAWVKRESKTQVCADHEDGLVFSYGRYGYGLGLRRNGHLILTKVDQGSIMSQATTNDMDYHHLAVTKSGLQVTFYRDGAPVQTMEYKAVFEFTTDAAVGARGDNLQNMFLGCIDEVMVFKRALTEAEIKAIYNAQK